MGRRKTLIINICVTVFTAVLLFLILELITRQLGLAPVFTQYHEYCGDILRPNAEGIFREEGYAHIKINSKGLRDYEYSFDKKPNIFRIVILGDSFTAAFQVELENTYHKILERLLNNRLNTERRFEVISVSKPNYGTAEEYLRLKWDGIKYEPDLVILAFYNGNDVRNNSAKLDKNVRPFFHLVNEELVLDKSYKIENRYKNSVIGYHHLLRKISRLIWNNSNFYRFLRARIDIFISQINAEVSKFKQNDPNSIPKDYRVFSPKYDETWQQAVETTKAIVLQVKHFATLHEADFLFLSIPSGEQVHPEARNALLKSYPMSRDLDFGKPEKLFKNFCIQNNLNNLFLLDNFRHYLSGSNEKLYFNYNGHLTPKGHQVLAEVLFKKIISDYNE